MRPTIQTGFGDECDPLPVEIHRSREERIVLRYAMAGHAQVPIWNHDSEWQ